MRATNWFLIGYTAYFIGERTLLLGTAQLVESPWTGRSWAHEETYCSCLLDGHAVKLHSKYLSLRPQTQAALSHGEGSFVLQWAGANGEMHHWSQCSARKQALFINLTIIKGQSHYRSWAERIEEPEYVEESVKCCFPGMTWLSQSW